MYLNSGYIHFFFLLTSQGGCDSNHEGEKGKNNIPKVGLNALPQ